MTTIGERIKNRRKGLSLSLDEVARAAKISKTYLWDIESRGGKGVGAMVLLAISDALDVPILYLLTGKQ